MPFKLSLLPFLLSMAILCPLAAGCQANRSGAKAKDPKVIAALDRAAAMGSSVEDVARLAVTVRGGEHAMRQQRSGWSDDDQKDLLVIRGRQLTAAEPALLAAARGNLKNGEQVPFDTWFAGPDLGHPTVKAVGEVRKQATSKINQARREARNVQEKRVVDGFMDAVGLQTPQRREEHKAAGRCPDCAGRGKVTITKPVVERCTACGGSGSPLGSLRSCTLCGGSGRNTVEQYAGTRPCGTCGGSGKYK